MPRKSSIKWRRSDEEELKRVVKNFNSKLSRILKKNPEIAEYLPDRVTVKDLKNNITSRQQLNRELNSLRRFSKRGSEEIITSKTGLKVTKWEKKEVGIQVAIINRERTRKKKQLESEEATSRGQKLNQTRSQMNSIRMNELNKKVFNFDKIKKSDWDKYKATVKRQSHPDFQSEADENLRKNYIKGIKEIFGETETTRQLIKIIESTPLKDFITKFYKEQEATVDFIYDPIEAERKLKILKDDVWNMYFDHDQGLVTVEEYEDFIRKNKVYRTKKKQKTYRKRRKKK